MTAEAFAELFATAVQRGGWRTTFREPIPVALPPPVAPSISGDTPADPIGDADVERAIQALNRVSCRRDSKSWQRFMERVERGK